MKLGYPHSAARRTLATGALAIGMATAATAQQVGPQEEGSIEEISVTGSRILVSGFEAPTPVTVVSKKDFENIGATNISVALNQMPAFYASTTPAATTLNSYTNGGNVPNLRVLGATRTLVLVDGRRHVATSNAATVDLNVIPSAAIARVDVVTGGASAAWGSDAVAGVVNIILDRELEGIRSSVQYGQSTHGDAQDTLFSFAAGGGFAQDRGHFMLAGEYNKDEGIAHQRDRDWGREGWSWLSQPGTPSKVIVPNVNVALGTEGGRILGPGVLANIQFGPGGTLVPYHPGTLISGALQSGGDGADIGQYRGLAVPFTRKNIFTHVSYSVTDAIDAYVDASYAESHATSPTVQTFDFGLTIKGDNAFIPADLRALMSANNINSFSLGRVNTDLGFITADTVYQTSRAVFGFKGKFGSDWSWDAYYQYGETEFTNQQFNARIEANFANAVDAVVNPATGQVVCRATLSGGAPGCVPINLFGFGSPSAAAIRYVNGTAFLSRTLSQQVVAASLSGSLFQLPAGAVTSAAGLEYRKEESRSHADSVAVAGGYGIVGNTTPISGSFDVKEGFLEVNVPVLANVPTVELFDINGAVRETDYSLSGSVRTWKVGFNYQPVGDLRLRGTYSRDIRAPNIGELFTSNATSFTNILDPRTGVVNPLVKVISGGNLDLRPEEATTKTIGIVYQPRQLEGLRMAVDYYDIRVADAIGTLGSQTLVDTCERGAANACAAITRDPTTGQLVQVNQTQLNIAEMTASGLDIETAWSRNMLGGDMTFRVVGNRVYHLRNSPDGLIFSDTAGVVGPNFGALPHWRGSFSATYERGAAAVFGQVRYVGGGVFNGTWTAADIADNDISGVTYLDASTKYRFELGGNHLELFGGVNNLLDRDPPINPINFIVPVATNVQLYDVVGRFVYGGVRLQF